MVKISFGVHQGKIKACGQVMKIFYKTVYYDYFMPYVYRFNIKHYKVGWGVDIFYLKVFDFIHVCKFTEERMIEEGHLKAAVLWHQKYERFLKEIGLENYIN